MVLEESKQEVIRAEDMLNSCDQTAVQNVVSHLLCLTLLNNAAKYVESLTHVGLLKDSEAEHYLEEIEESLAMVSLCSADSHPGELAEEDKTSSGSGTVPEEVGSVDS